MRVPKEVAWRFRPREVAVPDALWQDRTLPEGAKYFWCKLRLLRDARPASRTLITTYTELRVETQVSHNRINEYLIALESAGWLEVTRLGRSRLQVVIRWPRGVSFLRLPDDILRDHELPHAARWIWGVVRRLGQPFDYGQLIALTGYSHNTLTHHVKVLREREWLQGEHRFMARRKLFSLVVANPLESRRQAELARFLKAAQLVERTNRYSWGQFIAEQMVVIRAGAHVVRNGAASWLANDDTGAWLECDVLLHKHRVVIEFQGPQHDGPTERFSDPQEVAALQKRDQLKRQRCRQAGFWLGEVRARDLSFAAIDRLLKEARVPIQPLPDEKRYVYALLEYCAAQYRAAAERRAIEGLAISRA
ncbi:hypothetical protein [Symbiobacterium terraclitae]|uniref:hypothetical protein n=1 Tax=Symbiobacterium terraclitae TaxID=557451 RepID=UPI0035B55EC1